MKSLKKVAMSPWDFTLYQCADGNFVLKVMFTEGDYKVDVGRYFTFDARDLTIPSETDKLKVISNYIRNNYEKYKGREISKEDLNVL